MLFRVVKSYQHNLDFLFVEQLFELHCTLHFCRGIERDTVCRNLLRGRIWLVDHTYQLHLRSLECKSSSNRGGRGLHGYEGRIEVH